MAEEEVNLRAGMTDEISIALERIENRLGSVEDKLAEVGAAGKIMGEGVDAGASKAKRSIDGAGRAAETAAPKIKRAGDSAERAGAKAELGSKGFDRFATRVKKSGKSMGDFGLITKGIKWGSIATGIYLLAGAVSAVGAAAVIGMAHIGPLLLNLLNLGPAALTASLAMTTLKLASTQLQKPLGQIQKDFTGLGKEIAGGGLLSGVQSLARHMKPLSEVSGAGMRLFGADLGGAARQLGVFISRTSTLNEVSDIFSGLTGVLNPVLRGLLALLPGVLALIKAIIPSTQGMARMFETIALSLTHWIQVQSASGNITRWLMKAWQGLQDAGLAVWFVIQGLFNILRDAYNATDGLGGGVLVLTRRFLDWTASARGQQQITGFFEAAVPVIKQLGSLLFTAAGMLAHLAGSANISPMLAQIQTQLLPAIGRLLNHLTQIGGIGPGLISLFTNLANILSGLNFSGFSIIVHSLVTITGWIAWLIANVPGANTVISAMLAIWLGFKAVGPIIEGIGGALELLGKAAKIQAVSSAMETLGIVGLMALDGLSAGISAVGGALKAAFVTSPIGWIILAIIAVVAAVIILWKKFAWFRNAVKAVWAAILTAAKAVWSALVTAWNAVVNALAVAIRAVVGVFTAIWNTIVTVAKAIWSVLVVVWKVIWTIISTYVKVYIAIVRFIIQTAIYIIVGLITLILIAGKAVFQGIAFVARWAWNTVIHPIFNFLAMVAKAVWSGIATAAQFCWNLIVAGAQWVWNTILLPIFTIIGTTARAIWTGISSAAQFCWNLIRAGASAIWNGFLHPIFSAIARVGQAIWGGIVTQAQGAWARIKAIWSVVSGWFRGIWNGISSVAISVWHGIQKAISTVGGVVKGVWNAIVGAVKAVWNFIAKGWNSIPSFTVPSWIPVIGGKTFSLPKLPTLYTGGYAPGGPAIVGEHGPELLVRHGNVAGVLGAGGPTIANLPRGGYVVPNATTVARGMAKPIPAPIAAAVARSASVPPAPAPASRRDDRALLTAINRLTAAVEGQEPPIHVDRDTGSVREEVRKALRDRDREKRARKRYSYTAGKGL